MMLPLDWFQVEFPSALLDYEEALKLEPDFATALYNKATINYRYQSSIKGAVRVGEITLKALCISTSFWELEASESWSEYLFGLFHTFFFFTTFLPFHLFWLKRRKKMQ